MAEVNIGAARVHVVADMTDWDSAIQQGINAANGFSTQAQAAFDRTEGSVRRAAARLLDMSRNVNTTQAQMEQYVRVASRAGVTEPITRAAIENWDRLQKRVAAATAELQQNAAAADQAAQNFQKMTNQQFAPGLGGDPADAARRRADAEAALLPILQQQERAYEAIHAEALQINAAFDAQRAASAQAAFNAQLGIGATSASNMGATIDALTADFRQMDLAIDEAFKQDADIERFRRQLENLSQTAGKTHYELLQLKADQLGVGESFRPMIQGIQKQNESMGRGTISAKQYEWAMRGVPAQITDITTSLIAGQPAYLVMLQQGGQLKDMFGGIAPAARALATAMWRMVTPWTAAAAAIGYVTFAAYDAAKSMEELAVAVGKGDSIAGTTREMYELANALGQIDEINLGKAEESVARLASTGKLSGDNFRLAAEAAARWATATGEGADQVAARFEAIAKGPLEAIEGGQVRVTNKQYDYIRSLVESGREQDAVNELTRIYYNTVNNNAATVESHLTGMTRLWRGIKDELGDATRSVGDFFNEVVAGYVNATEAARRARDNGAGFFGSRAALFNPANWSAPAESAAGPADGSGRYDPEAEARDRKRTESLARWSATADKAAQRQNTLNELRAEGQRLGQTEAAINAVLVRQQKEWAEQDARRATRAAGRQGRDGTQAIRDAATAEIAAITTQTRLLQSQYEQREITVENYYEKLRGYADQELAVTMRSIEAQKAAVAGREDAATRLDQLESQAARAREQYAQRSIDMADAERKAIQQREIAFRSYVLTLQDANEAAQRDADLAVARVSMGGKEYERMVALNDLLRERNRMEAELARQVQDGALNSEDAERYRAALELVNEQIRIMQEGWVRVDAAESNALNGAARAWQDWLDQVSDKAQSAYEVTTAALSGAVDAITESIYGNLDSWEDYFDNLNKMILKFIVEQKLTEWIKSLNQPSANGGGGSGWMGWFGQLFGALMGGSTANAQGNVYAGSGLSAYRNSIVSQPTLFPFARGGVPNVGLMGERSGKPHEAIIPLTRTAGGDLGVRMVDSGRQRSTTVNQTIMVQGVMDRRTQDQIAVKTSREMSIAARRNG